MEREPKEISIDLAFLFKIPRRCFCSIHRIRWARIISFAQSITIIRISRLLDRLYDRTTLFVKDILLDLNFLKILKSFALFESRTKKRYLILEEITDSDSSSTHKYLQCLNSPSNNNEITNGYIGVSSSAFCNYLCKASFKNIYSK